MATLAATTVKGTEEDAPEDFFRFVSQELMHGPVITCEKNTAFEASPGATAQSHLGLNWSKAFEFEDDANEPSALVDSSSYQMASCVLSQGNYAERIFWV